MCVECVCGGRGGEEEEGEGGEKGQRRRGGGEEGGGIGIVLFVPRQERGAVTSLLYSDIYTYGGRY